MKKSSELIKQGRVVSVKNNGTARVEFPDADGVVSYDLRVIFPKTQRDKFISMPDIGEQVLCIFLPNDDPNGFIIGGFYSQRDTVPTTALTKPYCWQFQDGSRIEYDKQSHQYTLDIKGHVKINSAQSVTVTCPNIVMNGNVTINGALTVSDGVTSQGAITGNGNIAITGTSTLKGNLSVDGNINASGSIRGN